MEIKMNEFGSILTGREFGSSVYKELKPTLSAPVLLDFSGVESLGSSFGDEVVPPIARAQGGKISIKNSNRVIQRILKDIGKDGEVEIEFL